MTVIIGLKHQGKVYMGADSCRLVDWHHVYSSESKLIEKSNMLIAGEGKHLFPGIIQSRFAPECDEYSIYSLVEAIKDLFKDAGALGKTEDGADYMDCSLMIARPGELYVVGSDFNIINVAEYAAIGAGAKYAYGYIYAFGYEDAPYATLHGAMECAEHFCAAVRGPFEVRVI